MYDNIGNKIKTLAKISTWIGIVFALILGIALIVLLGAFIGLLVMFGVILIVWITSFPLYALGEITTTLSDIERNTRPNLANGAETPKKKKIFSPAPIAPADGSTPQIVCPKCGTQHDFDYPKCPKCKYEYNWAK
ncbi:MAG: hypothetical protein IJV96_00600 [Clostridia bacterium]|nr:hypothetical protein [Clostridia bacterium]